MIYGIGTDIVKVERLAAMWARYGDKCLNRVLAPSEQDGFKRAADKGRFLAKRFAAKEAFAKALGTGIRPPATLSAIGVGHNELGKPILEFHGLLADQMVHQQIISHLSLSDEVEYAIAYVILEKAS